MFLPGLQLPMVVVPAIHENLVQLVTSGRLPSYGPKLLTSRIWLVDPSKLI
jgi:hypothetical protein